MQSFIEECVDGVRDRYSKSIELFGAPETVTDVLVELMHFCDATKGVSWARCIEAARRQHQKEVREAADAMPLESSPAPAVGRKKRWQTDLTR